MSERDYILSDSLFWDVDKASINLETNAPYIVQRVLERGKLNDWKHLVSRYGIPRIAEIAQSLRTLDSKALSFISTVSSVPKESFRCYTMKPSSQTPWNY